MAISASTGQVEGRTDQSRAAYLEPSRAAVQKDALLHSSHAGCLFISFFCRLANMLKISMGQFMPVLYVLVAAWEGWVPQ